MSLSIVNRLLTYDVCKLRTYAILLEPIVEIETTKESPLDLLDAANLPIAFFKNVAKSVLTEGNGRKMIGSSRNRRSNKFPSINLDS